MNITATSSSYAPQRPDSATLFKSTDTNSDGVITKDELTTALSSRAEETGDTNGPTVDDLFSKLDADGDGSITEAEQEAGLAEMDSGGPGGPPPPTTDDSSDTSLVDTLKQLLTALESQSSSSTTSDSTDDTTSSTSSTSTTSTSSDTNVDDLIKQLVAELKKNSDTTGVLRATA